MVLQVHSKKRKKKKEKRNKKIKNKNEERRKKNEERKKKKEERKKKKEKKETRNKKKKEKSRFRTLRTGHTFRTRVVYTPKYTIGVQHIFGKYFSSTELLSRRTTRHGIPFV